MKNIPPKRWWKMVIYHGTSRKQITSNKQVDWKMAKITRMEFKWRTTLQKLPPKNRFPKFFHIFVDFGLHLLQYTSVHL